MLRGADEVQRNLQKWYKDGILAEAARAMEEIMAVLEGYAKTHHPWTPDTGATDVSTRGFIAAATPKIIIGILTAGMAYDVFLELAHDGKWSWLWPAIEANEDFIKKRLKDITG
jgi:hypothetical protein